MTGGSLPPGSHSFSDTGVEAISVVVFVGVDGLAKKNTRHTIESTAH